MKVSQILCKEPAKREIYISNTSTDQFVKVLSDHLNDGFENCLLVASNLRSMTGMTNGISNRAVLLIFVSYVNLDTHNVT